MHGSEIDAVLDHLMAKPFPDENHYFGEVLLTSSPAAEMALQ